MKELDIKLTEQELQYVVNTLVKQPFAEVYTLIDKIQKQVFQSQAE